MTEPDLTNCENEPIHIPGAIQPHGFLIALHEPDLVVTQISANLPDLLHRDADGLLGHPLAEALGEAQAESVRRALVGESLQEANPLRIALAGKTFDGLLHRHQGLALLELEPALPQRDAHAALLTRSIQRLQAAKSLRDLQEIAVQEVRALTSFDRVLLYHFDEDGHGEVLAEAKADPLDSYLGLHYPASDIPRQARELYRLNWLRAIPEADYEPVPLTPSERPDTGRPLDLSFSVLRSVSPIHREYLRNMGLRASMSFSLLKDDTLWGLISCGHRSPNFVPHAVRSACATLARLLSLQISALEEVEARRLRELKSGLVAGLVEAMRTARTDVLVGLAQRPEALLEIAGAAGAAIVVDEEILAVGDGPTEEEIRALGPWVQERTCGQDVFQTSHLSSDFPPAAAYAKRASGVLAISLPKPVRNAVLWFRPEVVQTVNWGGNPNKAAEAALQNGELRLHPRRSFELWKEEVRGHALRWRPDEISAVADLRRSAIEVDLARQVTREREAVRARDDLVAVVSHDLRSPIAAVVLQASLMKRVLVGDVTADSSRRLGGAVDRIYGVAERMSNLLQDLLDLSKIEAGRFEISPKPEEAAPLLEDACAIHAPIAESKSIALSCSSDSGLWVQADAERLFQVFSNLLGNAIKFTPEHGRIELTARRSEDGAEFAVQDNGAGIPANQLPFLFDRYWQARQGHGKGTGLGLYICRGIVEAHGGTIWVESAPSQGSTFFFTVPLAQGADGRSGVTTD